MSFIGSIVTKILNLQGIHPKKEGDGPPSIIPSASASPAAPAGSSSGTSPLAPNPAQGATGAPTPLSPASGPVDVEASLSALAAKSGEKLNWRTSIVDLLKLLDLDSSLTARKELAEELNYTGARDGSAEMNIWLHKQVMHKLEENGGKVPESLKTHS